MKIIQEREKYYLSPRQQFGERLIYSFTARLNNKSVYVSDSGVLVLSGKADYPSR